MLAVNCELENTIWSLLVNERRVGPVLELDGALKQERVLVGEFEYAQLRLRFILGHLSFDQARQLRCLDAAARFFPSGTIVADAPY